MLRETSYQLISNVMGEPNNSLCYQTISNFMREPNNSLCYQRLSYQIISVINVINVIRDFKPGNF